MKKFFFALIVFTGFAAVMPLFAQKFSEGKESEYFYVNVPLEKIYPYRKGYVILYRKGVNEMVRAYIPGEWFTESAGKAELVSLPPGTGWPYLVVFYKGGEFDHIRMYVHRLKSHSTWGNIPLTVNIDSEFENVEELRLEF